MTGRGWLSSLDKIPPEIRLKVAEMVLKNNASQIDIYGILKRDLNAVGVAAPSFSAFNRWVGTLYDQPQGQSKREKHAKIVHKTPSGPPETVSERRDFPISSRVSLETRTALKNVAKMRGRSVSAMLREWIDDRLVAEERSVGE